MSVLLVDEDGNVRSRMRSRLQERGIHVTVAATVAEAQAALELRSFGVVIVEMTLPDGTALGVLDHLRASGSASHVIVMGGQTGEGDRVRALERGADDFVVKPCYLGELTARVLAVRRRRDAVADRLLEIGRIHIDLRSREVSSAGETVELTAKEFDMLTYLAMRPGIVCDREQLLNAVWQSASEWQHAATVTEHIRRLRKKLEVDPAHPTLLITVRGVGYRLDLPTDAAVATTTAQVGQMAAERSGPTPTPLPPRLSRADVAERHGINDTRILVVDDEPMMLRAFEAALAQAGYEVLMSATGEQALEVAAREHPDVVLLDRHLPGVSGQEVLARLRSDPTTADAVILMVSGDDSVKRRLEGFEGGASDYLTKPVDLRELLARIEAQLSSRERWLGRLDAAMGARMRLATALVGLSDRTATLPDVLAELGRELDAELDIAGVALRTRQGGHLAPPVTLRDSRGGLDIAMSAGAAVDSPWLERAAGLVVVHVPLQTGAETFAVLSVEPRADPEQLLATLVDLAPQLSALLLPMVDAAVSTRSDRARVERLLQGDGMWPVFQPIVDLADRRVVGYEGLTRFVDGTRPDLGFTLAERLGMGVTLELEALRRVLETAQRLPENVWVSVNVSATTLLGADLDPLVAAMSHRLILEITEHELVTDYAAVLEAVAGLGDVRVAVDDAGSGYASLRHIYELRPDVVKLDRGWVSGIDHDPVRQAMIAGLRTFCRATGARLVGEGVEHGEEAVTLASLGVHWGQGLLFGRPDVLDHLLVTEETR